MTSNADGRGLDILESLEGEIFIKGTDIYPSDLDVVELRIIKFVKKHQKVWKDEAGRTNTTNHVRFLAHVFKYMKFDKKASALVEDESMAGVKCTFDPQAKLLSDVYIINDALKDKGISLFTRKVSFKRFDEKSQNTSGHFTTWLWDDLGEAPVTASDNWRTENVKSMIVNDNAANDAQAASTAGNTANNAGVDTGAKSPAYRLEMISDIKKLADAATSMVADYPAFKAEIYDAFIKQKAALAAKQAVDLSVNSSHMTRAEFSETAMRLAKGIYGKPQDAQRVQDLHDFAVSKFEFVLSEIEKTRNAHKQAVPQINSAQTGQSDLPDEDDIPF